MWRYHQHIAHKYHIYYLISFKIHFLNIHLICYRQSSLLSINFNFQKIFSSSVSISIYSSCFKYVFTLSKEVIVLSQIFAPHQETENPDLEVFFNIQFNCTGNPNANIENVSRFGCSYILDLTANTCNEKNINHYLLII